MKPAGVTSNEPERLAALRRYDILDTSAEARFDDLTRLASQICGMPIALISLVDAERQWFKSNIGLDATQTPRDISFCGHAIQGRDLFEVPNALEDQRFHDNPLVTGAPNIRFYAGAPLVTQDGLALGTLCVIGHVPHSLAPEQREALLALSRQAAHLLELRITVQQVRELNRTLAEKAAFQRTLLESATLAIISTTTDGVITSFNTAAEQLTGHEAGELVGKLTPGVLHDRMEVAVRARQLSDELGRKIEPGFEVFVAKVRAGEPESREWTYLRKDGTRVPVLLSISELRDEAGALIGFLGMANDLTESKRAEDHLNQFFELSVDMLCIANADGYFKRVNPAFTRTLGWSAEEILARPAFDFVHPDDHAATLREARRHVESGENVFNFESRFRHKDGSWRLLSWVSASKAGRFTFATARDVTEQKRIVEVLRAQGEELERANQMKSDFLANMSHELRTPLNSIIGCSEMLKDGVMGELGAKQRDFVADIFDAGTHLLLLINDILDLSKVEAGMLELEPIAVDVAALLEASMTVVREKALSSRIGLDTELDPALGSIVADQRKLKQIVYNLLSNAVKFTPDGGAVTLRAHRCTRAEVALGTDMPRRLLGLPDSEAGRDHEFLAITVEDSGVGIAELDLAKLFEPFVQVDSSVARRQGGTGLGLSLVRRLAELHGGTVGVTSRPGAGSRFCVWLPYREAAAAAQGGAKARALPKRAED